MFKQNLAISSLNIPKGFFPAGSEEPIEERLVEAAKRGHSTAFATLCERHAKQLFRAAQNITRNHEDAEDAVQDALLSAFVHLRNFDGRSKFGTWLTRIAINSALMILRKKRNAPVVDLDRVEDSSTGGLNHEIPDRAPNPELHYAKREEARILNNAIQQLRPALREVVQKQQLQETSIRETAVAMGISEAAAKARLFHARVKLRKLLRMMQCREHEQICVLSAIELVHAKMEDDLSLDEMAQSVGLSTAHFARMFRKSTGETPHQFVLRHRIERAKAMLRAPGARVLDVALACGFKTPQHFAQVFRDVCRVSPTEYRQDSLGSEATHAENLPFSI